MLEIRQTMRARHVDVAVPRQSGQLPGISMAGFHLTPSQLEDLRPNHASSRMLTGFLGFRFFHQLTVAVATTRSIPIARIATC